MRSCSGKKIPWKCMEENLETAQLGCITRLFPQRIESFVISGEQSLSSTRWKWNFVCSDVCSIMGALARPERIFSTPFEGEVEIKILLENLKMAPYYTSQPDLRKVQGKPFSTEVQSGT